MKGLEVIDLWVKAGDKTILKGVNLKLPPKEFHALVGPNGAGKSTLAMAIAGHPQYKVIKGDILLDGESIKDLPPEERAKRGLAVLLQHPPDLEGIRVAELLERLKKMYGCEESVESLISRVGLPGDVAFRYVNVGFSGGERKRFDLARILAMKPKIVIMDEPDSGVDVESVKMIADGIKRLLSQGAGVLVITHYRNILKYVVPHKVHVMIDGRIVKVGGPEILEVIEEKGFAGVVA